MTVMYNDLAATASFQFDLTVETSVMDLIVRAGSIKFSGTEYSFGSDLKLTVLEDTHVCAALVADKVTNVVILVDLMTAPVDPTVSDILSIVAEMLVPAGAVSLSAVDVHVIRRKDVVDQDPTSLLGNLAP